MSISEKMRLEREELSKLLPGQNKSLNHYYSQDFYSVGCEIYKFLDDPFRGEFPYMAEEDVF